MRKQTLKTLEIDSHLPNFTILATNVHVILRRYAMLIWMHDDIE